jgi:hypothetical protein
MPPSIPSVFYPVFESSVLLGKEGASTPGTAATAFTGIPTGPLQTSNKVIPLSDENLRGSNVKTYDLQLGPRHAEITIPESPCYCDTIGMPLVGLMGDFTTTGTAGTPTWTTSGALSPGAGPIAVTTGSSAVAGTYVQIDTSVNAEVVKVGTGSTTTSIVVDPSTPIRFSHLTGVAVTTVTAPFSHTISNINPASSTGNSSAHPPTYTLLHKNLLGTTYGIDQYVYTNFSAVKLQAKAEGWFVWDGKATAYVRAYPAAGQTPSFSSVRGFPSWKSGISFAGSPVYNISDLTIDIQREIDTINTADGVEDPYAFGAGPLTAMFDATFNAIQDETQLNWLLNNTQPTLSWTITNGGSGASLYSFTVNAQLAALKTSDLTVMKTQWGWKISGELLANTTNSGNSSGYSPLSIVLQNAIATY